jgi:sulfur-carrier protein adenylyltransferase/sulfurtransferase
VTQTMSLKALQWLQTQGAPTRLLDVRSESEFAEGHLPGATNVPVASLATTIAALVPDPKTPIVVYCQHGPRAEQAHAVLLALGYRRTMRLACGYAEVAKGPSTARSEIATEDPRYARQRILLGGAAQDRLQHARVLVVGAGGLGSPASMYLAAAGVGTLGIADADTVELSNLNRQILHVRAGDSKTESALRSLQALNPQVQVQALPRITEHNAADLVANFEIVVDGSDNLETRYVVSDAALAASKQVVQGAVHKYEGQIATYGVRNGERTCYRCLFPTPDNAARNCSELGVLGATCGVLGSMMALEAIRIAAGETPAFFGALTTVDTRTLESIRVRVRSKCTACAAPR